MFRKIARIFLGALLASALTAGVPLIGTATADPAGAVHFVRLADSGFDGFTSSPTAGGQEWLRSHMWRMIVWSPYFDGRTSWYPNGWVYDDSYAIYRGSSLASEHPEWILRDSAGHPLYIPSGCSGGSCPQYAGDISNPAFRHAWIEELKGEVAKGYRGVFVDDVNMVMEVGNGNEESVAPIDRSTGQPMTPEVWRGYMARFMQEVRAQLPGTEIVHNAIWCAAEHAGTANANIRAEIESANYIFLERGANDSGLTGGEGQYSLKAFLSFVDQVHAVGRGVVMDGTSSTPQGLTYNLANYFLVSGGDDAVSGDAQTPENWWSGWSVELGEALGPRYAWNHLTRRDFAGGMVLVNAPGEPTQTIALPTPMRDAEGVTVSSVTLGPGSGAILRGTTPPSGEGAGGGTAGGPTTGSGGTTTGSDSGSTAGSTGGSTSSTGSTGGSTTGGGPTGGSTWGSGSTAGGTGGSTSGTGSTSHGGSLPGHRGRHIPHFKRGDRRARAAGVHRYPARHRRRHRHGGSHRTLAAQH